MTVLEVPVMVFSTPDVLVGRLKITASPELIVFVTGPPNSTQLNTDLSGVVIFSVEPAGVAIVALPALELKFVLAVLGNAQSGAGSVANGPATNVASNNLLREKLMF